MDGVRVSLIRMISSIFLAFSVAQNKQHNKIRKVSKIGPFDITSHLSLCIFALVHKQFFLSLISHSEAVSSNLHHGNQAERMTKWRKNNINK